MELYLVYSFRLNRHFILLQWDNANNERCDISA